MARSRAVGPDFRTAFAGTAITNSIELEAEYIDRGYERIPTGLQRKRIAWQVEQLRKLKSRDRLSAEQFAAAQAFQSCVARAAIGGSPGLPPIRTRRSPLNACGLPAGIKPEANVADRRLTDHSGHCDRRRSVLMTRCRLMPLAVEWPRSGDSRHHGDFLPTTALGQGVDH